MSNELHRDYPHLLFKKNWELSKNAQFLLGQCDAFVKAINNTPIMPQHYKELMVISLVKGAQATTAIEGNTLTDEDIKLVMEGKKMPPSKEYQEIEVKNIIDAHNELLSELIQDDSTSLINSELIKRFQKMVGKNLGDHFGAIPGQFRNNEVTVGRYRCPDHLDVPILIDRLCEWQKLEFGYQKKEQTFAEIIVQAIVSHIYIEWIHPFGDGNGRTGRLLEFYLLLRGGNPDIASHILSNHYNLTRTDYYRQIEKATASRDLSEFIEYALLGFRDGLFQTLEIIQKSQFTNSWQKFIYDIFDTVSITKKDAFKRQRTLALELPMDRFVNVHEIPILSIKLAKLYSNISSRTLLRDLDKLKELNLITRENSQISANVAQLRGSMFARRRHATSH